MSFNGVIIAKRPSSPTTITESIPMPSS